VSRLLTVTGLAVRELWISFRLLVAVGAIVVAALPTALLPAAPFELAGRSWTTLQLFGIGLGVALALVAGLAAGALAGERRRGTIGWLVSRSVPRPVVVLGWFSAFAVVLLLGLVPAGALAWLTAGEATGTLDGPLALAVPMLAAWAAGAAAVTVGLFLGSLLPSIPAGLLTGLLVATALVPAAAGVAPDLAATPAPAAGLALLGGLGDVSRPIADSLRSAGMSMAIAAAGLVLGAATLGRADL
jgi:hypothetical protein